MGLRRPEGLLGLQMATVLGPDHPAAAEAVAGARRIFTELRAQAWLDRLEEIEARWSAHAGEPRPAERAPVVPG